MNIFHDRGFKTDGIDSSKIAVEMTKKRLVNESIILCVNMFEFEIPKNKVEYLQRS